MLSVANRRPSIGGTAIGLFAAGGAVRDVLDDHASMCCVAISLGAWLRRIACGVRREFTANCSSSESSFQNAPCRVTCETGRRDRHRPGAHLSRITWASSNSTRECCHQTCGRWPRRRVAPYVSASFVRLAAWVEAMRAV